jgi:hypothetical protein
VSDVEFRFVGRPWVSPPDVENDPLKRELVDAIEALWGETSDVEPWNHFWLKRCAFNKGWKLPEGFDFNLPLGTGTSMLGRNWDNLNLGNGHFPGKNFSNYRLRSASLYHANLSRCSFVGADLTKSNLEAANLSGADFTDADLTNVNLKGARLKGAILKNARLDGADLRFAQDVELDENPIRGTRFLSRFGRVLNRDNFPGEYVDWAEPLGSFEDRWSRLRRKYTGPRFALVLLMTLAFFIPRIVKVAALVWLGQTETTVIEQVAAGRLGVTPEIVAAVDRWSGGLRASGEDALATLDRNWMAAYASASISPTVQRHIDEARQAAIERLRASLARREDRLRDELIELLGRTRERVFEQLQRAYDRRPHVRVWQVLLELDSGRYYLTAMAVLLLVFNVARLAVTVMVGSLREAEERSHVTPGAIEYALPYKLHRVTSVLWYVAIAELGVELLRWLNTSVTM